MKLNTNYFRVRLTMIFAPLATVVFLLSCVFFILPDYLLTVKDVESDRGVLQSATRNVYPKKRYLLPDAMRDCVDIRMQGKNYLIRLDDKAETGKWDVITDSANVGKNIEIKYPGSYFQKGIVLNPKELSIDDEVIIHFDANKNTVLIAFIGFSIITLLFGFASYLAIKTYREDLLSEDKMLYRSNKWKLIWLWLRE